VLAQRREAIQSLRSDSSIAVTSPERSGKAHQFIVVERPDRLRVEVLSPFGVVFALTSSDGDLAAYVREENRVYRGAATPANLARYAALDLKVTDVVDVLLGGAPQRQVSDASVYAEPSTGLVRLRQETAQGAQVVVFGDESRLPVEVQELDHDGALVWRAEFSNYRTVANVAVATRIAVELPSQKEKVEINYDGPDVNPTLSASLFSLPTPPGGEEVQL